MIRTIFILLLITLGACQELEPAPPALVGILSRDRIEIIAESNDPLISIYYAEGDIVMAGNVVSEQSPTLYQTRLEQLVAIRDRLHYRLAELERGPRSETIVAAEARLDGFINDVSIQQREYQRLSRLMEQQLATPSSLDRILELKQKAESNRNQARAELNLLRAGTSSEELNQARSALAEAEAGINTQLVILDRLRQTSPVNGTLERLYYEAGERPVPGSTIAVILANAAPYARVYIPENLLSKIHTGQSVEIRVDGIDTSYPGKVRYISSEAAFTPYYALTHRDRSRLSYLAEIDVSGEGAGDLPNGIPLEVILPGLKQAIVE